jgi:hypothetical protein
MGGNRRRRRVIWIVVAGVGGFAMAAYIAAFVYSSVNSVSVRFVNDTQHAVILSDCGPDLEAIPAQLSAVVNVFQPTRYCSIDVEGPSRSELAGRCVKMPNPLQNGDVVHISEAARDLKPCS